MKKHKRTINKLMSTCMSMKHPRNLTCIWLFLLPGAGSFIGILIVSSQFVTTIDLRALYSV